MSMKNKLTVVIMVKMEMGLVMESFWGLMVALLQLFVSVFLSFLPPIPSLSLSLSLDVLFLVAPIITVLEVISFSFFGDPFDHLVFFEWWVYWLVF